MTYISTLGGRRCRKWISCSGRRILLALFLKEDWPFVLPGAGGQGMKRAVYSQHCFSSDCGMCHLVRALHHEDSSSGPMSSHHACHVHWPNFNYKYLSKGTLPPLHRIFPLWRREIKYICTYYLVSYVYNKQVIYNHSYKQINNSLSHM